MDRVLLRIRLLAPGFTAGVIKSRLSTSPTTEGKSPLRILVPGLIAMGALVLALVFLLQGRAAPLPVISQVTSFALTNQVGNIVSLKDMQGKVWIANIIFTHCPGPCREMSKRMERLQSELARQPLVQLVSLTADPVVDTPEVLHRYSLSYHADPARWWFLTGPKADLIRLAVDELKLTVVDKQERLRQSVDDLFIHSTISVLVDKQGRLRAAVEVLEPGATEKLRDLALQLLAE
jgi:protein SCO1/2